MSKVFIVAGELSGDKLGAWYAKRLLKEDPKIKIHAVGGDFLKSAGAGLFDRFEKLNVVGIVEILKHLRFIFKFMKKLTDHIINNNYDHVVVVDFPGFNLRLVKRLKKANPDIKITYLSPPQLWIWGEGRIKIIKKYCDEVIVLYPFEVNWYKKRGVDVVWLGYPFYEKFKPFFSQSERNKNRIALIPGSRSIEIKRLLPLFARVFCNLQRVHPDLKVVIPLAESVKKDVVEKELTRVGLKNFSIIKGEQEKFKALSSCRLALTKPGTVTLELALLGISAIVAYKASWISYVLAKMLVNIKQMSLPNLLLGDLVYPEFIQGDCTEQKLTHVVRELYENGDGEVQEKLVRLREILKS
ncbi:lipid-A-disaccharide synthase [Candidatus Babeliales bacterium]|nr:lipid-A-disaccharide synthase [Candidatus Babeliales bacterium]